MDRIQGELTELRALCVKYLDDTDTTVPAPAGSGMMGRTGPVSRDREYAVAMHERVTRLEDSLLELIHELRESRISELGSAYRDSGYR